MQYSYTPYVLLYFFAALIALALAIAVAQRRSAPGALACLVNLLAIAEWSGATGCYILGADVATKVFWLNMMYIGVPIVPPALLVFVARYTGIDHWLSRRRLAALCLAPLIIILVIWTNDYHHLQRSHSVLDNSGPFLVLHSNIGPWLWVNALYSYALALFAFGLLIRALRRTSSLHRRQLVAIFAGALVPIVGTVLDIFFLSPWPQIDLTPILFTITGAAFAVAIVRFRLLDIVPVARDAIIESLEDGVIVLDHLRRVVDMNPAAARVIGHTAANAIGTAVEQLWPVSSELLDAPTSGEIAIGDGALQRVIAVRSSPFYARDGQRIGQLVVLHDVTVQRQSETERLTLERKLQTAQKLESIGIFAGGIAHDFNNMIGIILGTTSLALAELPPQSPIREDLEIVRSTARRAAELTQQILLYAGYGLPNIERLDLNELIAEMSGLLQASTTPRVRLQQQHTPLALPLLADATQLRQVAFNLVINASEAIGDADGVITLKTAQCNVDESELLSFQIVPTTGKRYAVLEVTDSGPGINPETIANIFEPFFSTKLMGRGLGLAVVQGIIRGHHGALRVYSAPGEGATFTILLPLAEHETHEHASKVVGGDEV